MSLGSARVRRAHLARAARFGALLALVPLVALVLAAALTPLPAELRDRRYAQSVRYLDRDGVLLREVRADDAARARWIPLDEVGPDALAAILAAEDRHFYAHPGIDPVAVVRAVVTSAARGRVVSGASTLTMQLARVVRPHRRNLLGKLGEMALALRIEVSLSKREILEEYVNRAPFGPNLRGLDAASRFYLDKPPSELSLAESAALAAIPRGPSVYAMAKHPERVVRRRDRILGRLEANGVLGADAANRARAEPLAVRLSRASFGAPHLVQALHDGALVALGGPARGATLEAVTTTIARDLQREAETAMVVTLKPLARRHVTAASVVVLDNASGEILAYVGSPSFFDVAIAGQNDGARAKRQPGSTLKPFVYGLAFERLGYTPATVLHDVETHVDVTSSVYTPRNYDERYHGPVRVREALANSFNVPAVLVAEAVGTARLLERLRDVGFASLDEAPEHYGPALALGDGEVTLLELANAYATLARGGVWRPVRAVRGARAVPATPSPDAAALLAPTDEARRVMPETTALLVADILKDKNARLASFGERSALELPLEVAAKTGTSKGYRDNWTVGFTREVTVAVWVGNFDGSPMSGVSGITGAAPLFRAVMEAAMRGRASSPVGITSGAGESDGARDASPFVRARVCPLSGAAPTDACPHAVDEWLPLSAPQLVPCANHERVAVDTRTALRAGPSCPPAHAEERVFERFDPELLAWARAARRDVAPTAYSPLCALPTATELRGGHEAQAAAPVRIGYPHDGARFLLDPDRPLREQTIAVRVEAPASASKVSIRVDGAVVARVPSPFVARWGLAKGDHTIFAEADGTRSEPVRVRVD